MSRPWKDRKSGIYCFRQKTPADLVVVFGENEVSWPLRTKTRRRPRGGMRKRAIVWERLRKRPKPLPHQQIVALSGTIYPDGWRLARRCGRLEPKRCAT